MADTGPGLADDAKAVVFGEFVQTEAGARAGGAGLGLAIVKRLADAFNGAVGVDSTPGMGAAFWFEADFPVAAQERTARPLAGMMVGVVSPSPIVRAAAARQIKASGGDVVAAPDLRGVGSDARVVLIDGAARRMRPSRTTPSIILLAPEERRRIAPARAAGFKGYLIKPLRRDSVAERIIATLASGPARSNAPKLSAAEEPPDDERAAPAATVGGRVLLVEDNPVNALLARALLTREGCAVDRAATGHEAVAAGQTPYDLILMDLRLPDLDGLSAARALRACGVITPIVALTANSFEDDRQACLAAGMVDFLAKPLEPAALRAVLHRWIASGTDRERGLAPGAAA